MLEYNPIHTFQAVSGPQDVIAAPTAITAAAFSQFGTDWLHRSVRYEMDGPGGRVLVKDDQQNIEMQRTRLHSAFYVQEPALNSIHHHY
jgi:hypothetical protein